MRTEQEIRKEIERIITEKNNIKINATLLNTLFIRLWALKWVLEEENYD